MQNKHLDQMAEVVGGCMAFFIGLATSIIGFMIAFFVPWWLGIIAVVGFFFGGFYLVADISDRELGTYLVRRK